MNINIPRQTVCMVVNQIMVIMLLAFARLWVKSHRMTVPFSVSFCWRLTIDDFCRDRGPTCGFLLPSQTCLYNFDPLYWTHFYIVKLGFTWVYIIFLIFAQKHRLWVLGGSNEYPQSMFWAEIWKISDLFYLKIFIFLVVKFSVYLNRRIFVG